MTENISGKLFSAPRNNWSLALARKHLSFKLRYCAWLATDKSFLLNLFFARTTISRIGFLLLHNHAVVTNISKEDVYVSHRTTLNETY